MNKPCLDTANPVPPVAVALKGDSRLRLEPGACLAARSLPGACDRCARSCPVQALRVADEGPLLAGSCLGCGRCGRACPTGALSVEGFEIASPLPTGNEPLSIDCWKVPAGLTGGRAVRTPCLAGVGAEQILEWADAADGAPLHILDRGWCAGCSAGAGESPPVALAEAAAALLAQCGLPDTLLPRLVRAPLPASLMPKDIPQPRSQARVDRRGFFRRLGAETAAALAPAGARRRPSVRKAEWCALPKRERLLGAARALAAAHGRPAPASLFPRLTASDRCDHGQGCVTLCPTGALRSYEMEGHAGVEFDADRCVACGLCVRACQQQALAPAPASDAPPEETQRLTRFELHSCGACLKPYAGIGEHRLCPDCRRNRQMVQQLFGIQVADG